MLAYVFWHWPRPDVEPARYLEALRSFHATLKAFPPQGYRGSRILEVEGAPWAKAPRAFEDWYFLDGFDALGALNEAAVSGLRKAPHDGAARLSQGGAAGIYLRRAEGFGALHQASWFGKPEGIPYPAFLSQVPQGELWQRQLVLGPTPEFCLFDVTPPASAGSPVALEVSRLLD